MTKRKKRKRKKKRIENAHKGSAVQELNVI
jgi:hypothetical protein